MEKRGWIDLSTVFPPHAKSGDKTIGGVVGWSCRRLTLLLAVFSRVQNTRMSHGVCAGTMYRRSLSRISLLYIRDLRPGMKNRGHRQRGQNRQRASVRGVGRRRTHTLMPHGPASQRVALVSPATYFSNSDDHCTGIFHHHLAGFGLKSSFHVETICIMSLHISIVILDFPPGLQSSVLVVWLLYQPIGTLIPEIMNHERSAAWREWLFNLYC